MYSIKTALGKTLKIRNCSLTDVEEHFDILKETIEPEQYESYKEKLRECITAGTAYCTENNSCLFYYLKRDKAFADAIAIYGKGKPLEMLALKQLIFHEIDNDTIFIYLTLHKKTEVKDYRAFFTRLNFKRYRRKRENLLIRVDKLREKFIELESKRP